MEKIQKLIKWFLYITPGIIFVCAINIEIAGDETVPARVLWQILLAGFLTALVTLLFYLREEKKKRMIFVDVMLHYAMLCAVMVGCGCQFGWIKFNAAGIITMFMSVAAVYLLVFFIYYQIDLRQAEKINRKLKEKYGNEEMENQKTVKNCQLYEGKETKIQDGEDNEDGEE